MSDTMQTESTLQITPDDVSINEQGAVEIVNPRLAEAVKAAIAKTESRLAANKNTGCGNNLYQCKPTAAQA